MLMLTLEAKLEMLMERLLTTFLPHFLTTVIVKLNLCV